MAEQASETGKDLQLFVERLVFAEVYTRSIVSNHSPGFDLRSNAILDSFSRFNWQVSGPEIFTSTELPEDDPLQYLYRFLFPTEVTIAHNPAPGVIVPNEQEIPEGLKIGTILVQFVVEYRSSLAPDQVNQQFMEIFSKKIVPLHGWNFWREALSNLALRAKLPIPNLPGFPNM